MARDFPWWVHISVGSRGWLGGEAGIVNINTRSGLAGCDRLPDGDVRLGKPENSPDCCSLLPLSPRQPAARGATQGFIGLFRANAVGLGEEEEDLRRACYSAQVLNRNKN
jgi:hypothetical protein